ncbi:MAG: Alpha/beta hydrolase family protein [Syntrophaceae bacterium PtaU1.Bin231]|nr:MAG: Alpha/beta hydrolase family protein [Syntrophaceae bacterium PtaU1.Bin231]
MEDRQKKASGFFDLMGKIGRLYTERAMHAQKAFAEHLQKAAMDPNLAVGLPPENPLQSWTSYVTDAAQRAVLFWDILRERGNNYIEHKKEGTPPLLAFKWEIVLDGRTFDRPVNYALIRIIPPKGVRVDETKRPFIIVDPRAGHGPGIGGFKKDSEVGVALEFGHPVYFVIFFPEPEPGQTILDVCAAETKFLETVVQRHPKSPKPTIYGNCQGGWASMMIAANDPDKVGSIVVNGAPMSYWSGSWSEGEGENPMRYSGGLLGGSWLALFASDLGNGKFDGAYLVENFENLNPANTNWNKYYNVWKNVDTEKERFLEFEKWWGGYFLMNEEEIRWIVDNLFVGNKLARGEVKAAPGTYLNLKAIRSPIVIFSSKGDNITPPQQAINWIADVYSSTAEIKANGQVIVALVQEDVGHLGIFVSGKIAQKEHTEIIEALDYIERLRPGLYVMDLQETSGTGKDRYLSSFREVRLEDMRSLNRLERKDEKPFEVVAEVSELNEKAYSLFGRPIVRSLVNEKTAELGRNLHPLRVQRWFFSDFNPLMWPVAAMAPAVKAGRKPAEAGNPWRKLEAMGAEMITASWNFYRDMRDATSESLFFQIYGSMIALGVSGDVKPAGPAVEKTDPREMPFAREALAQIEKGGYPEALARIGALLGRHAGPIPLHRLAMTDEFIRSDKVLSKLSEDEARRLRSEAGVMVLLEPERTLHALPALLSRKEDRERTLRILEWALSLDGITKEQRDMGNRIVGLLRSDAPGSGKARPTGKGNKKA